MDRRTRTITDLLASADDGDRSSFERLLPHVYDELHALASSFFRQQRANHTLQPTALVNEAYLRLANHEAIRARTREQFYALAAQVMRRLLIDHARERNAEKRGGRWERITLSGVGTDDGEQELDLVALDEAMRALADHNAEAARVVELRYFGGLTNEQIASVIGASRGAVDRRWRLARAWLYTALEDSGDEGSSP